MTELLLKSDIENVRFVNRDVTRPFDWADTVYNGEQ